MRLPTPYRPEAEIVSHRLASLKGALDWAGRRRPSPRPWVRAVRDQPPPFWAMESLLREYPISSAEGLALMRLAEALLRVPDAETAIALTADQLGRADFDGAAPIRRWRACRPGHRAVEEVPAGRSEQRARPDGRLGARTVVAATLRAVQLLGRQFVLGQTIDEAMGEAAVGAAQGTPRCASATTCWAKARAPTPMRCATWTAIVNAIQSIAARRRPAGAPEAQRRHLDQAQRAASALRGRPARARDARTGAARVAAVRAGGATPTSTSPSTPKRWTASNCRSTCSRRWRRASRRAARSGGASGWRCRPTRRARWN